MRHLPSTLVGVPAQGIHDCTFARPVQHIDSLHGAAHGSGHGRCAARNKYGAAARQDLGRTQACRNRNRTNCKFVVLILAARRGFNPLRSGKRPRSIYESEEWDEVHPQQLALTPSDGRDRAATQNRNMKCQHSGGPKRADCGMVFPGFSPEGSSQHLHEGYS